MNNNKIAAATAVTRIKSKPIICRLGIYYFTKSDYIHRASTQQKGNNRKNDKNKNAKPTTSMNEFNSIEKQSPFDKICLNGCIVIRRKCFILFLTKSKKKKSNVFDNICVFLIQNQRAIVIVWYSQICIYVAWIISMQMRTKWIEKFPRVKIIYQTNREDLSSICLH